MKKFRNENELRNALENDFPVPERIFPKNIEARLTGSSKLDLSAAHDKDIGADSLAATHSQSRNKTDANVYAKGPRLWTIGVAAAAIAIIAGANFFFGADINISTGNSPVRDSTPADDPELPEGIRYDYGETAVAYIEENYENLITEPIVSENEHLRVTIESLICDDITINITAKIEALDEEGMAHLEAGTTRHTLSEEVDEDKDIPYVPEIVTYDENGRYLSVRGITTHWTSSLGSTNQPDTESCRYFIADFEKYYLDGAQKIHLKLYHDDSVSGDNEPEEGIIDIFSGIEFDIDTASNLKTLACVSDSGKEIYVSPLGFYNRKTELWGIDGPRSYGGFTVYYEDGTSVEYSVNSFGWEYYDTDNVTSIDFNGETYYPQ